MKVGLPDLPLPEPLLGLLDGQRVLAGGVPQANQQLFSHPSAHTRSSILF